MLLSLSDVDLMFRLHKSLMFFVNQRLEVLTDRPANPDAYSALPVSTRFKVHQAFIQHQELIQVFVDENPAGLPQDELDIVLSWKHLVHGRFIIYRELSKYTVFMTTDKLPIAYGVMALTERFSELISPQLPIMVQATLLPFKGQIAYDGLISSYNIAFGSGIRRGLNEDFKDAKARHGVVTSLPMSQTPLLPKPPRAKPVTKAPSKQDVAQTLHVITELIDTFCREHLNDEYAMVCRKLAEKLARKRPSPLLRGSPNSWASGIVRTIGSANFLHDKSQTPTMRLSDIDAGFGIGESTGSAKQTAIRKMFKIHPLDPNWTLPSRLEDNPMVWMVLVNGMMMDMRTAPWAMQEMAFKKGLIPYIPGSKDAGLTGR